MISSKVDGALGPVPSADEMKLRKTAQDMQGMFVEQLFKAMRETVPEGGVVDGGAGEEMFSSMLDQHLSSEVGRGWDRGIGAALYRQLSAVLPPSAPETPEAPAAPDAAAAPQTPPVEG